MPLSTYVMLSGSADSLPSSMLSKDAVSVQHTTDLPRSASHTYLPSLNGATPDVPLSYGMKRTLSETVLAALPRDNESFLSFNSKSKGNTNQLERSQSTKMSRRKSTTTPSPKITISKFAKSSEKAMGDTSYDSRSSPNMAKSGPGPAESKARGMSESLATLARKSLMLTPSSSRSPSPDGRVSQKDVVQASSSTPLSSTRKDLVAFELQSNPEVKGPASGPESKAARRRSMMLQDRLPKRPLSMFMKASSLENAGQNTSTTIPTTNPGRSETPPPLPKSISADRLQSFGGETTRKKDELWSVFRSLETDFHKFQSKSITLKANVVRTSLLPFLRTYADHRSNTWIRPEDLDRRTNILHKWWTGLLDMVSGKNNQTISGTDRPVLLDGIAGIMTRPEWRASPSLFAPLRDLRSQSIIKSRSTTSLESSSSEFFAESVHHNVRNMFVQNLYAQLKFVIDKMSLKQAPSSLVAFCGKALAYAFFFCPGVAETLVRLWSVSSDLVRRVLTELGIDRATNMRKTSESIVPGFPPALGALGFSSYASMAKHLRKRPTLPVGIDIPSTGLWLGRWCGRDTDLFFVFVKYYHILLADFLPSTVNKQEKACAPAFVIIHVQVLAVLDATLHRKGIEQGKESVSSTPAPVTFDEVLAGADVAVAPLPLPGGNVTRAMAENRLIMLLRDLLSGAQPLSATARQNFAEVFGDLLKAAARGVSIYDHHACFALCDFMDEAIPILVRYQHTTPSATESLDWEFWLDVCKQMAQGQNSMTAIRLFGFLFGIWGTITSDEQRKRSLCLKWLLSETTFDTYFNHWCPMVRAYYMRLLCWRVARSDGIASELDLRIFDTLLERLRKAWSDFLYLRHKCTVDRLIPPSTAPCSPAPGRRLVIIRNDSHVAPGSVPLSFDGTISSSSNQPTAYREQSSLASISQNESASAIPSRLQSASLETSIAPGSPSKKRWGLFRNMLAFGNPLAEGFKLEGDANMPKSTHSESAGPTPSPDRTEDRGSHLTQRKSKALGSDGGTPQDTPQHRYLSFKFSLEWTERPNQPVKELKLSPPRLPFAAQMLLQSRKAGPPNAMGADIIRLSPVGSKYVGRALAEWALVVAEYQNFFERRKAEGVPSDRFVETPTLGVDTFRRLG